MGKYNGSYSVKGYAKYTNNGAETGHSGKFEGSTSRIGENLSHSVPHAGGSCADSAADMAVNKNYIDSRDK